MYSDGDFSVAQHHGAPTVARPFYGVGDPAHMILTQPCVVDRASYVPTVIGTAHPTISGLVLVEENMDTDLLVGLMQFNRVYANKPAPWDDYESYNFSYWPIMRTVLMAYSPVREGGSRTVTSRIHRDYFRIGVGLDYATPSDIPITPKFIPTWVQPGFSYTSEAWWIGNLEGNITTPNEIAFLAMGEIVAEASEVTRYRGDIWERATRYVPVGEVPS